MPEMLTAYLLPGKPLKFICTVKHKAKPCRRPHCLADLSPRHRPIWTGEWPKDEIGDLRIDVKQARREHANAKKRWATKLKHLQSVSPAPAFASYHKSLIDQHMKDVPVFTFTPRSSFSGRTS